MNTINEQESKDYMINRHGDVFLECLNDNTLNIDYSNCPIQVLIQPKIPHSRVEELDEYNIQNNTKIGWSASSLFGLKKNKNKYTKEFEICKTDAGKRMLKKFLECIISSDLNKSDTVEKHIETEQYNRNSRRTCIDTPLMYLIFLPINTRNNIISTLQEAIVKFLEENNLWTEYHIVFSNSNTDSGSVLQTYNNFIKSCMTETRELGKKGCILLLGNKGSTGITYPDCDVTISIDDGHSISNQKQRNSRSLTPSIGKTIGINVDMNLQRTYLSISELLRNYRQNTNTTMSNAEILTYMYTKNIFIFNPQEFNFGQCKKSVISSYYNNEMDEMRKYLIDEKKLLEGIECDDDLKEYIKTDLSVKRNIDKKVNPDIEGEQQELQKPTTTRTEIDSDEKSNSESEEKTNTEEKKSEDDIKEDVLINKTRELCKTFFIPFIALLSQRKKIDDFNIIIRDYKDIIISVLNEKKIEIDLKQYNIFRNIMSFIIKNNIEIINSIRDIYNSKSSIVIRQLVEKHFLSTLKEQKEHAEIPTPVILVEEMLNTVPVTYWSSITNKTFESCCGKGNFVLGIVDRMLKGLEHIENKKFILCRY